MEDNIQIIRLKFKKWLIDQIYQDFGCLKSLAKAQSVTDHMLQKAFALMINQT